MKNFVYFTFVSLFFLSITSSHAQRSAKLFIDPVTHEYKVTEIEDQQANARITDSDITQTVTPYAARPESMINIHLDFGPNVNIDDVFTINFSIFPECGENCKAQGFAYSWLSTKAVNKTARTVDFVMGGMLPNTSYLLRTYVFGVDGDPCGGRVLLLPFTTGSASSQQKKMLMVINEEWQNNSSVQAKLDQYISDIQTSMPNLSIEKYYLENNSFAKIALYDYISQHFLTDNISYLFFIGDNASTYSFKNGLDESGNVANSSGVITFQHYTHPLYKHYSYDPAYYYLQSTKYQNTCFRPSQEVREAVFEQRNPLMSVGMVIPAPNLNAQDKSNYLVNYFTKLHRFRNKEITFNKEVLLTDAFVSEQNVVAMAKANGRWSSAETINFGRPKDPDYSGEDPVWKADFLNKLENKSYEIFSLNLHGSPDYQSFGIYKDDINNLSKLNIQLLSLSSCNIGNYKGDNYLGGEYLGKGNVMNVHAYSDLLFLFTINGASGLEYEYLTNGAFTLMASGFTVSDAYRYAAGYSEIEVILGDPLVKFQDSNPLPVVLKNFNVKTEGKSALLYWSTASESNSEHFEIERRSNGKKWTLIGKVTAGGESTSDRNYTFSDTDPNPGQNLYRLKMVDRASGRYDGSFTYSQIRSVTFENGAYLIYPNPVSDKILFNADLQDRIKSVTIADATGKVVLRTSKIPDNGISVKPFVTGLYVVRIEMADGSAEVKKVIVDR